VPQLPLFNPTAAATAQDGRPTGGAKPRPRRPGLALEIAADLASISLAFEAAIKVRLALGGSPLARMNEQTLDPFTPPLWLLLTVWLFAAWLTRLYRARRGAGLFQTAVGVVQAMGLATALVVLLSFALFEHGSGLSRTFIALLLPIGMTTALALRAGLRVGTMVVRSGDRPERLLLIGNGDGSRGLVDRFVHAADNSVAVCGVIATSIGSAADAAVPVLGTIRDLRHAVNLTRAQRVVVVDAHLPPESLAECIDVCATMHIPLNCADWQLSGFPSPVEMTDVAGVKLLEVRPRAFEDFDGIIKRATDVAVAGVVLVASLPLLLVLAISIKLSSPGPVLYIADRVGRGGRHFRCFKFRSMVAGADALRWTVHPPGRLDHHVFKVRNDARITAVGRFMRRLSLDELPQLVNVILGDMSLVGPRPLPARDLDPDGLSTGHRIWSVERSTVRPGLTGLWQIRGRSSLPFEEMARLDLLYVRNRSYRLDIQILLQTVPVVISGRGAM